MRRLVINKKILGFACFVCVALAALGFSAGSVHAATLFVSPSTSNISVGNIVTSKVLVNTDSKSINNAEAIVQFPTDLLEVISVSKGASIFSLWVEDPKFSNSAGTITFNGGVPNPGYSGQAGEIVSITFRAKKSGTATVAFSDSAVRQNDGLGTDILSSKLPAVIQVGEVTPVELPVVNSSDLPAIPLITSASHPQQNSWYTNKNASFSWVVPNGVVSVQTLLGKIANSIPTITYDSSVSQRTVNDLADGILYFHLRYQNSVGWGPTAHYKIQIDATPPEKLGVQVRIEGARTIASLRAEDPTSGIDYYSVKIDDSAAVKVKGSSLENGEYVLSPQPKGEHRLTVAAYDKAGNHAETSTSYTSPEITVPSVSLVQAEIGRGDVADISGKSDYPQTEISVIVQPESGTQRIYTTVSGSDGSFALKTDQFEQSGRYEVWAQNVFSETVKSGFSKKVSLVVTDTPFVKTTKQINYILLVVVPLVLLLVILFLIAYVGWHKFFGIKKKIGHELETMTKDVHGVMVSFKQELNKQLSILEKVKEDRNLNKKEEKIFAELKENVDTIEEFIEKKIKKIIKK